MKILTVYPTNINTRHIDSAVEALRDGLPVIYPTDSGYALAADALNKKAVARLCALKGLNPDKNLLSVVCADLSQASAYVHIDNTAYDIVRRYLPGPYTFVLPASSRLPKTFGRRRTIGLRIPDNAIARMLAQTLGNPLLTASAGDSDEALDIADAYDHNPDVALVIDGGTCPLRPTTIVDITDPAAPDIVRQGAAPF